MPDFPPAAAPRAACSSGGGRRLRAPGRLYDGVGIFWKIAFAAAMRVKARGLDHAERAAAESGGGVLLAVSHVSHLDPVVLSTLLRRRVSWMAREEFYRHGLWAWFLDRMGAFPVNRQGRALPGIRAALSKLRAGEAVGIFPEGEIMRGVDSVLRGGPIRRGVALLAARTGVPVVPVVVSGTQRLNRVLPWLPIKSGKLWVAAGPALHAPPDTNTRAGRDAFAARLERALVEVYAELRREFPQPETEVP
ncbi:MAG: lysophospholipid acyltransferase family protein [Verrucomicrobiota bacterium]